MTAEEHTMEDPVWWEDAVERCDPDSHEPTDDPARADFPCWGCRLDAYFAHELDDAG